MRKPPALYDAPTDSVVMACALPATPPKPYSTPKYRPFLAYEYDTAFWSKMPPCSAPPPALLLPAVAAIQYSTMENELVKPRGSVEAEAMMAGSNCSPAANVPQSPESVTLASRANIWVW